MARKSWHLGERPRNTDRSAFLSFLKVRLHDGGLCPTRLWLQSDTFAALHPGPHGRRDVSRETAMAMAMKRGSSDDADLVKLYLRDIGRYPLLTKDDEAQLAQAMEAGREAEMALAEPGTRLTPAKKRELRRVQATGAAAEQSFVVVQPAPGGVYRQEVPGVGSSASRPGSGGEPRSHPCGGEVRLAQGVQVLDLRHVVDPPGHHPRHRQHGPDHPSAGACRETC